MLTLAHLLSRRDRRLLPVPRRRRLGDREPHRAVGADGAVSVPDRGHRARRLLFGSKELADEVAQHPAAKPGRPRWRRRSRSEIHSVLTGARGDVLTIGVVLAIYFASSGIESLRIGLNRAYGVSSEPRAGGCCGWNRSATCWSRAVALLVLAFLVVLAPLIFATAVRYVPLARAAVAACSTSCAIAVAVDRADRRADDRAQMAAGRPAAARRHRARHRRDAGAVAASPANCSAAIWREFAYTYVTYYAGLASAMIALVFLYVIASIFIFGGELNAAIAALRAKASRSGNGLRGGIGQLSAPPRSRPRGSAAPDAAR